MASRGIRAFAFSYLNVIFAIYLDRLGYSTVTIGVVFTVAYLSGALLTAVWGYLSDRYPAGILSSVGLFCLTAGLLALSLLPASPGDGQIVWRMVLCGIGFTMSLFIGLLAFPTPELEAEAKLGILLGSSASALCGAAILWRPARIDLRGPKPL